MLSTAIYFIPLALLLAAGIWQWRRQRLLSLRVRLMREALHNRDFTFRLPNDSRLPGEHDLQVALNDMCGEIGRLLARSEVESWQRLTRVLTHEIMNAIAPVSSITQAYMASPLVKGTPLEEGMQAIHDTTRGLQTFVESYRKLTQLQAANIEPVSIHRLMDNMKALHTGMEWNMDTTATDTLRAHTVSADAGMLHQVTANIIKNAIEAGARRIDMRTGIADSHIQLLISNDGAPIPPDVEREIFIPFFTTKGTGSGIGLSLARQMMMVQGGDLRLADTPQPGYHTTFVVVTGYDGQTAKADAHTRKGRQNPVKQS